MAFAARSPYNLRLTHLLRVVVIIAQNMISYAHVEYFNQHVYNLFISARPAALNMSLTLKQLERMFTAVTERTEGIAEACICYTGEVLNKNNNILNRGPP